MQVKFDSFPVVYYHAFCKKHNCLVELNPFPGNRTTTGIVSGGRLVSIRCEKGGTVSETNCMHDWEITISAIGAITIDN